MSLNLYTVEDSDRKAKAPSDPTLSPEGKALAKRVQAAQHAWLAISRWGEQASRWKGNFTHQEQLAFAAYEALRLKLTWPVWSVHASEEAITRQMREIHGAHRRIKRLVPSAFAPFLIAA